jgi:hypothetical protein
MTPEEHQVEHVRLHRALDELLACYIAENCGRLPEQILDASLPSGRSGSIHNPILHLLEWAHQKTMQPTLPPQEHANPRSPADFESERQMILLALAELALSRPGFEDSLKEIARYYDGEDLAMFESFKRTSSDRVKAERIPMLMGPLVAQHDDPELLEWLGNAQARAGGFVSNLAYAGLVADHDNYPLIRPLLVQMRQKYPQYEPSDAVKQEIRERAGRI